MKLSKKDKLWVEKISEKSVILKLIHFTTSLVKEIIRTIKSIINWRALDKLYLIKLNKTERE